MSHRPFARLPRSVAVACHLAVGPLSAPCLQAQPQPLRAPNVSTGALTPADLLAIRTVSAGDFSPDGMWLLVRIAMRGDGLGFVAARDGDPSYTRPSPARLLLMNTVTGDTTPIVHTPRTIGAVAWSRSGNRLAIATRDTVPQLLLH